MRYLIFFLLIAIGIACKGPQQMSNKQTPQFKEIYFDKLVGGQQNDGTTLDFHLIEDASNADFKLISLVFRDTTLFLKELEKGHWNAQLKAPITFSKDSLAMALNYEYNHQSARLFLELISLRNTIHLP